MPTSRVEHTTTGYKRTWTYREFEVRSRWSEVRYPDNPIMQVDTTDSRYNAKSGTLQTESGNAWGDDGSAPHQRAMIDSEILAANMTSLNSDLPSRYYVAKLNAEHGYHGPVQPGEARALSRCFKELGMPDLVRRSWIVRTKTLKTRRMSRYQLRAWIRQNPAVNTQANAPIRTVTADVLQYCYTFRSPMTDVPFTKFLKLAKLYRDKTGLRKAVAAVLANPEAHSEIDTADAIDILAGLKGMD